MPYLVEEILHHLRALWRQTLRVRERAPQERDVYSSKQATHIRENLDEKRARCIAVTAWETPAWFDKVNADPYRFAGCRSWTRERCCCWWCGCRLGNAALRSWEERKGGAARRARPRAFAGDDDATLWRAFFAPDSCRSFLLSLSSQTLSKREYSPLSGLILQTNPISRGYRF